MRTDDTGSQRIHQADHVRRPELRLDEPRDRLAHRHAGAAAHVVVVEENREQPHVVARRFDLLVVVGADLLRRLRRRLGTVPPSSLISLKVSIFCGLPSSVTSKSACFRSATGLPVLSVTMTSTRTKLMPVRKIGGGCCGGGCCSWARRGTPKTMARSRPAAAHPTCDRTDLLHVVQRAIPLS